MTKRNNGNESLLWVLFFERVFKRFPVLLAVVACAGLLGGLYSKFFVVPVYRANAELIVNAAERTTQSITSEQLNTAETLVEIYGIIIKSDAVLEKAARRINAGLDYDSLAEKVSVGAVNGTAVMRVSVTDTDPQLAMKILEEILRIAPDVIQDKVEAGSVKVISEPRLESKPISPKIMQNALLSAILGMVLALAILLLRIVRNDTISSKQQLESRFNLSVLAEIPVVGQRGSRSALLTENSGFAYKEAFRYLQTNVNLLAASNEQKAIVVTSSVSGEGKTSVSINLAKSLAAAGKRVILVECDLRMPTISQYLSLTGTGSDQNGLQGLLSGACILNDAVIQQDGLFLITSGGTSENSVELLGSKRMRLLISLLKEQYDYIIMDAPPAGELADAISLCAASDSLLLVVRENYANLKSIQNTTDQIRKSEIHLLGSVLTFCNPKVSKMRRGYSRYSYYGKYSKEK